MNYNNKKISISISLSLIRYLEIIEDYKNKHSIARRDKEDLQKKYDKLKQSSDEYLEKTANLKDKYTWLLQKIEELSQ